MRIQNIYSNINNRPFFFKGSSAVEPEIKPKDYEPRNNKKGEEDKPLPEWLRKFMLGSIVFFAFKNDPYVQNLLHPYEPTQEDIDKTEFFQDVEKVRKEKGISTAFYHINSLYDIEQPKIKSIGKGSYSLEFQLDKQNINMEMTLDENSKDTIFGRVKLRERDFVNFVAIFPDEDKDEFKVIIKDKNDRKYVFGRDYSGELYQVRGGKKVPLNKKNVERYEEYQDMLESLDDWKFFTNQNDFWRKANIVLIIFLLLNEMVHDKSKRRMKELEKWVEENDKLLADLLKQLKNAGSTKDKIKIMEEIDKYLKETDISKNKDIDKKDKEKDNKKPEV